jgi:hypothetical protein
MRLLNYEIELLPIVLTWEGKFRAIFLSFSCNICKYFFHWTRLRFFFEIVFSHDFFSSTHTSICQETSFTFSPTHGTSCEETSFTCHICTYFFHWTRLRFFHWRMSQFVRKSIRLFSCNFFFIGHE